MPFLPNSSLFKKNNVRNINYMPALVFFNASIGEEMLILGQTPMRNVLQSFQVKCLSISVKYRIHPTITWITWKNTW